MSRLIYPARRAVEHAVTIPGVRPVRLFPVLWPLWQVDTEAYVYDEQTYEVIDRFLTRGIAEAGLDTADELARFFALPASLVQRCLRFLELIGHTQTVDGRIRLTPLGTESLAADIRYEPKQSRQTLLLDQLTGWPLLRRYYDGAVPVLSTREVPPDRLDDRSEFLTVSVDRYFTPELVQRLEHTSERARFNLPSRLRNLSVLTHGNAYLPVYLIETSSHGLLVYSGLAEERDTFLERVCQQVDVMRNRIEAQELGKPRDIWTRWLAEFQYGPGILRELDNGVWRVTFRPKAFGDAPRLPVTRLGSYEIRKHHLLQLWCDDARLRREAVLERALGIARLSQVETVADLDRRVATVARALDVAAPRFDEIRRYARDKGVPAPVLSPSL